MIPRISFNSPLVLTFTFVCAAILALDQEVIGNLIPAFFALNSKSNDWLTYTKLVTYVFGHASWQHLIGNLTYILLLGPALEERHGWKMLLAMMLITIVTSGALSLWVFDTGLMGSSGIVFMFILLSSFTNSQAGTIPLTFLLVAPLFLLKEITAALQEDSVSQFAHLMGGGFGALFGYLRR